MNNLKNFDYEKKSFIVAVLSLLITSVALVIAVFAWLYPKAPITEAKLEAPKQELVKQEPVKPAPTPEASSLKPEATPVITPSPEMKTEVTAPPGKKKAKPKERQSQNQPDETGEYPNESDEIADNNEQRRCSVSMNGQAVVDEDGNPLQIPC